MATDNKEIVPGVYHHYKGGLYQVLGTGIHTENEEPLVMYINEKGKFFARPQWMWNQVVKHEGITMKRFTLLLKVTQHRIALKELLDSNREG